eukprot:1013416-Karenia_brevis.AAC.1
MTLLMMKHGAESEMTMIMMMVMILMIARASDGDVYGGGDAIDGYGYLCYKSYTDGSFCAKKRCFPGLTFVIRDAEMCM